MLIAKNRIVADDEIDVDVTEPIDDVDIDVEDKGSEINVDEDATELLFEAEDVAQLVAEVSGQSVDVTVEPDVKSSSPFFADKVYPVPDVGNVIV